MQQLRELLRRSRLHIDDLERKRRDLDAHIGEFKEVGDPGQRRAARIAASIRRATETQRRRTMAVYKAPLKDINFVLNEVLDVSSLAKLPGYQDATPDTIQAILEEAAKLCENVLFPLNRTGDEEGCTLRERRRAHAQGLQGRLRPVPRGRLDGGDLRSRVRRPGPAGDGGLRAAGDVHRVEPGLRDVSRPEPRRLRGAARARLGRAQEGATCPSSPTAPGPARCA